MVRNIITDLCHHLEIGIDGNLDIGNKRVIVGTPTITLTDNILTISCDTAGASIYYTLDGSTPTSASTRYTTAVTLSNSCTIKAIAIKGSKSSIVVSQDYVAILTAWRLVGNSVVHTDEYLTSWKVEGNSVVDNNTILSCGDYSDVDGKYHVKISNGVTIYDIALTEPLRKVNNVVDTIEFPSTIEGKALVTRNLSSDDLGDLDYMQVSTNITDVKRFRAPIEDMKLSAKVLTAIYDVSSSTWSCIEGVNTTNQYIFIYDANYNQVGDTTAFINHVRGSEILYELATPTTELVDVSPFPVSATDTYTSANVVPYSAFEYTENKEIWSCGEYSEIDNKYHIVVLPQGKSPVDIALTEPLRKVNDVADTIEFPVTLEAFCNTDGTQIETALPDNTILHIQNLIASVQAVSVTGLTVTVNSDNSLSIVGNNTTGGYIFDIIGTTNSRISSSNYTYLSGIAGGGKSIYDTRYGGNIQVFSKQEVVQETMQGYNLQFMLRAGASVDGILYPTALNLNAMFADAQELMPTTTSDFTTMFPNIKVIPFSDSAVDVIVKDGKLYKYVETEGKALLTIRVEENDGELSPLDTPTTELVDAPQIEEADSYSMVINPGGKAVAWTEFVVNPT